ncbi:MAG TPA: TetR/AcrR family transcriptional regulator [Stellaceae bacterium]|nr:TetR/AcrR family transcriptional regulator [Stellaceae bacterium]
MRRGPTTLTAIAQAEPPRRSGRPSRERAARLGGDIVAVAAELFLVDGYGATSIETVARRAGVSKRTIYSRFPDKAALFRAVVRQVLDRLRPPDVDALFAGGPLVRVLEGLARTILAAALDPLALALYRLSVAEAARFPDVAVALGAEGGRNEAVGRLSALLAAAAPGRSPEEVQLAAAHFLYMVIAVPQRRALGLGPAMSAAELDQWARATVSLFLDGWGRPREGF